MKSQSIKKILLAIDPLEDDLKLSQEAVRELKYWVSHLNAEVEAVYVFSGPDKDLRVNRAYMLASDALDQTLAKLHLGFKIKPTVLVDETTSRRHSIQTFLKYASKAKADLVVLTSHGRTGLSRLAFGSFAESLLADSPIPVLFLGVKPSHHASLKRVLFPTDFSAESEKSFEATLKQLAPLKPEMILFHSVPPKSFLYDYSLMGLGAYLPNDYWKAQKEILIQTGERWVKKALKVGLKARFIIDDESIDTTSAIQKISQSEKIPLIALSCKKVGPIVGSLFRSQKFGVWLYGSNAVDSLVRSRAASRRV